ncbi:MAG: diguanylate cyclase [Acetobacteraceae bacterium]|nr:diguanylate cyclase [Acetobacteraceae bacterium]
MTPARPAPARRWLALPLVRALLAWAVSSAVLLAATGTYLDRLQEREEAAAVRQAQADASTAEQTFLRTVEAVRSVLGWVELWQTLADRGDVTGAEAVEAELRRMVAAGRLGLVQVRITGDNGYVSWSTASETVGVWGGDREQFLVHVGETPPPGLFIGAPVAGRRTGLVSVRFSQRIFHADGAPAGVAAVHINAATLSLTLGGANPSPHQLVTLRRLDDGVLLAHSVSAAQHLAREPDADHPAVLAAREAPVGILRYASGADGRAVLAAYRVPEGLPVVVQSVLDAEAAMAGFSRAVRNTLAALGVAVLAGLAVAIAWASRSESLQALRDSEARLQDSEARFRLLAEHSGDVVTLNGLDGTRRYVSPAAEAVLGWRPDDLTAVTVRDAVHPDDRAWVDAALEALRAGKPTASATYRFRRADGGWLWVEVNARVYHAPDGSPAGYVAVIRNASERKRAERQLLDAYEEMETLASTDPLTGLANRRRFTTRLDDEWRRCAREEQPLSLLIADVDRFKRFNDRYGHPAGDRCLQGVAAALGEAARRPGDLAARLGGEEFALIMPNTDEAGARHVAERFRQALRAKAMPHDDNDGRGTVTASVGLATVLPKPLDGPRAPEGALSAADAALYAAKAAGRDRVVAHAPSPRTDVAAGSGRIGGARPRPASRA